MSLLDVIDPLLKHRDFRKLYAKAFVASNDIAFILRMSKTKVLRCLSTRDAIPTPHRSAL